ncbi:hypothetical protein [Escherichia coli]|nr:hypothetical protein [Escherichia coli]EIX6872362.1 hypothetical protein [Escherichia coli]MBB8823338.1 hypothetical protein [Escherichia coli]
MPCSVKFVLDVLYQCVDAPAHILALAITTIPVTGSFKPSGLFPPALQK